MKKAMVLLSGGQDSTTSLFWALREFDEVEALSIYYGQRHQAELQAADDIRKLAGVTHRVLEIPALGSLGGSALVSNNEIRSTGGIVDREMPGGLPTSFVPGRNLIMLSLLGAAAVHAGAKDLVTGVCQTDYSGYPDCRNEFIESFETTLNLAMPSSSGPFKVHTPLMWLTKAETVLLARELGDDCWAAVSRSITCYEGLRPGCGKCPACILRVKGFEEAGVRDPAR